MVDLMTLAVLSDAAAAAAAGPVAAQSSLSVYHKQAPELVDPLDDEEREGNQRLVKMAVSTGAARLTTVCSSSSFVASSSYSFYCCCFFFLTCALVFYYGCVYN